MTSSPKLAIAALACTLAGGAIVFRGAFFSEEAPSREAPAGQETPPQEAPPVAPPGEGDTLTAVQAIAAHMEAERGPPQPIPFNHRFHTQALNMSCMYCHTGTDRSRVATMPPLELCMGCHRIVGNNLEPIEELRAYWEREEPVPWERVYKLPEFVQFTHQAHLRNDIACQECHGPVEEMDRVYQWSSLHMGWCLDCHMEEEAQPQDFATNYLLVREFPVPEIPAGRQDVGLYPIRIDENYGETRAPIDCFACHH